ncbi:glycosyltransferase [Roseivirga sp. BDSF3-8]|uniref:glycosyltransferase n=1 Tax=Roseivirga sp. BDSF3-8 TaxID=3241598 RepID=UPI003531FE42
MDPRVSVICLCYNHANFVEEALLSVISQTYENIEIIVVDDASTDGSREVIKNVARRHPWLQLHLLESNKGNCGAFNTGFRASTGDYIIDFATDDRMLPGHVDRLVGHFKKLPRNMGVLYTDACYINREGQITRAFYRRDKEGNITHPVIAEGNVFKEVVRRYFICTPTMMIRREVLERLGGYDESLAFEDFDFWVRSARDWGYRFLDYRGIHVRRTSGSMSRQQYRPGDRQLATTCKVLDKAWGLSENEEEREAVRSRIRYEYMLAVMTDNTYEAAQLMELLETTDGLGLRQRLLRLVSLVPVQKAWIRRSYQKVSHTIRMLK